MLIIILPLILLVGIFVFGGLIARKSSFSLSKKTIESIVKAGAIGGILVIIFLSIGLLTLSLNKVYATEEHNVKTEQIKTQSNNNIGVGLLAAAIAVSVGSLGAGIAVGMSASAAVGAISENPKIFGSAIVFVGLAEGIAIYGFILAIMILNKL